MARRKASGGTLNLRPSALVECSELSELHKLNHLRSRGKWDYGCPESHNDQKIGN